MDIKSAFEKIFQMPEFPRVRKTDPVTSHEAAEAIKPVAPKHYSVILDCLQTYGPLGKDGISAMTNLDSNQVARRLNEMQKIGLIKLTGKTVKSDSGRSEREWTA
jgi:DNA-binding HxlR family transcriptional regulator